MEAAPSRTAIQAAVARGVHRLEDMPPWILDDPFALVLVGPEWHEIWARLTTLFPERLLRQTRAGIALRSAYAEEHLLRSGCAQYVMLGAGLDSFAWRRPDLMPDLILFEVDHPASQGWKRQRVIDLGLPVGSRHVFAPVDFESESIREGLDRLGFDWAQPTFFSWLGVTSYLTIEAIEDTLRMIASCASGSQVAFTYSLADELADDDWREFVGIMGPLAASSGEPLQPGWSPGSIEELVTRAGLRVIDHPNRGVQIARYFANRSDRLQPWGACLIAAGVP